MTICMMQMELCFQSLKVPMTTKQLLLQLSTLIMIGVKKVILRQR